MSSSNSGGSNDDTFTNNSVSLSVVKIKNEVSEVKTNDNPNGVSLNINKEVTVNKVSNDCKTRGNYNGGIITKSNGNSLNVKQVMNYQVSGRVKISNDETLLNKNIGDILNNSGNNVVNNGKGIIKNVSSCDSGDNNKDDTFTNNCVTLSAVETKNKVSEVNTNNIQEEVSLNVKQVAVKMVSNNVSCDDVNKSEIFFFKNIGDILCNSNSENNSRKLVGVSNGVMISIDELEKEWLSLIHILVKYTVVIL